MPKVLFISNISTGVSSFSTASIAAAHANGLSFFYASNWAATSQAQREEDEKDYDIRICHIDLARSPFSLKNIKAYGQLVKLIQQEGIDCIHCNTPTGGFLGRLAGWKCGVKKVIYQAHGFHFYQGAPWRNWLCYYPVEWALAHFSDAIITINQEDYQASQRLKMRGKNQSYFVPGVGMNLTQFANISVDSQQKRAELGLKPTDIVLMSAGDLIPRKNYPVAIRAIAALKNPDLHYCICGRGPELESLQALAEQLQVSQQIHFLGFRKDVKELLSVADIFLFTTLQEGLPRSLMEAMASGLPCIASHIRGNVDLLEQGVGGLLCQPNDVTGLSQAIAQIAQDSALRQTMGQANLARIRHFDEKTVGDAMTGIYRDLLK